MHRVRVESDRFVDMSTGTPVTFAREGDVVEFVLVAGMHIVRPGVAAGLVALGDGPHSGWLTEPGQVYRYEIPASGAFPYACEVHLDMQGLLHASAPG